MKTFQFNQIRLTVATFLFTLPALAFAAPSATSPYYTDKVNSYVQDQVSKDMEGLNSFLCMVSAMAPDQMVNLGPYLAMVDTNACKPNTQNSGGGGGGGGGGGTQNFIKYQTFEVDSSRESNLKPMIAKIWIDDFTDSLAKKSKIRMYASASQAPSKYAPYGVFRMDYCNQFTSDTTDTTCSKHIGYVDATKSGLSFYTKDAKTDTTNGDYYEEFSLQLSSSSTTSNGSGIIIKTNTNNANGIPTTSAVVFANNNDYFYRDDGTNKKCFNRAESKAQESVWRYGLYNTDGSRLSRESGFPVAYTYTSANTSATGTVGETYYGYINYYGLSMPVTLEDNAKVTRKDINTGSTTTYTLKQTGGTLYKYSTYFKKLSDYNKLPFYFYPYNDVTGTSGTVMTAYNTYEIYWDKDANSGVGGFFVYSHQVYDSTNYIYNDIKYSTPVAINTASMAASLTSGAYPNGLYASSNSFGSFNINGTDFANLGTTLSNTKVITNSSGNVYPSDFAAINSSGGLRCLTDCLTKASIDYYTSQVTLATPNYYATQYTRPTYTYSFNSGTNIYSYVNHSYQLNFSVVNGNNSPFTDSTVTNSYLQVSPYTTYAPVTSLNNATSYVLGGLFYTLNPTTGNLVDSTGADVIQTVANYGIYGSGRLISKADFDTIVAQKCAGYPTVTCSTTISDSDIELLAAVSGSTGYSYYQWSTGADQYSHLSYLQDSGGNLVKLYPPLALTFTVPNVSSYGTYRNSTLYLNYGDFGSLWGIPNKCVDTRNNADCVYYDSTVTNCGTTAAPVACTGSYDYTKSTLITPPSNQYWTAQFSIPFDPDTGVVKAGFNGSDTTDPAYVAPGTQFLVKALEKEERLLNVDLNICTTQNLGTNISVSKLPSDAQWVNPSTSAGDKPVLNPLPAPRVIHGVVQY